MRRWLGLACGTILLFMAPAAATAQVRRCDLVQEADFRRLVNARSETIFYFLDPVRLRCTGGVFLAADSAVYNQSQLAMELVGAVVYRDSTSELTSDWANYQGNLEQLLARGQVVLTDLANGSVATGQELQYLRESATRPTSHTILRGGRPHAILREPPGEGAPAAAAGDTAAPLEVTADRLEFVGDTLFLARGSVDLERGPTTGAADTALYHQMEQRLTLLGEAHVRDERYRLEGERIDALVEGETLREVLAEQRASLLSEELTVRSERLHIGFVEGALDRLQAWNPLPPRPADTTADDAAPGERALALAEGFRLQADSIDAIADSGALREVRAVGRAYGERRLDSLAAELPAVVARDWIQGDTIIGHFTPAEAAPEADSAAVVLERVVVIGGSAPALSLYRTEPEVDAGRGAINFMKASRIILFMTEGEVARVEAEGPVDGLYLDPVVTRPATNGGGGT